jgi:GntR family transcriptional regulator
MLRKDLPIPLYHQLHTDLLNRIRSGELKPRGRLASEEDLAASYGVSKITVRHALRELAQAGYVRREQGRGTFVTMPKVEQGPRELTSFTEEMRRRGRLASSRVLSQGVIPAEGEAAEKLGISEGAPVFRLRRLRLADGQPMGVQTALVPLDLAPGLAQEQFEAASLYETLRRNYGLCPARAKETHSAVACDRETAMVLGVAEGSPVLAAERITLLRDGRPFELAESLMNGDRYSVVLDLGVDLPQRSEM